MEHPSTSAILHTAEVADRASFARFVGHLLEDFLEHPDEWENISLQDFLEAMQMHALDIMRQYHQVQQPDQHGAEQPNWRQFADLLLDARVKPL
jgi:hypothetical protein